MSSYIKNTSHPVTGKMEPALWIDDYFGRHHYGVQFKDGTVIDAEQTPLMTDNKPADASWDDFPKDTRNG